MKTVIIYESKHHGNTKKLCDAIAGIGSVDLIEAKKVNEGISWADYDLIGFASGIAYGNFYRNVRKAASQLPVGAKTFYLYTCARNDKDFAAGIKAIAREKGAVILGTHGCTGYNTFGPLKFTGGMNHGHPDEAEIQSAVSFYMDLIKSEK